jgi:sodium transport system permease protein
MGIVLHIFSKELREMFRDKRVISNALISPIVLIVLMLMLFGMLQRTLSDEATVRLHVVKPSSPSTFVDGLRKAPKLKIVEVANREQGRRLVESGDAEVVLDFAADFDALIATGQAKVIALYDEGRPRSAIALGAFRDAIREANSRALRQVLETKGVPPDLSEPIKLTPENVARNEAAGGPLPSLLPYLIIIWAFYGGFSIVSDMVAGEKERGTLETLLISPALRWQIAIGKYLALCVVCLLSSLTTLVGVAAVAALPIPVTSGLFPDGFGISATGFLAIAAVLLPLVALFAGVLLIFSAIAKNMREAQTYLTLVSFVVLMPAVFSQFIGFTGFDQSPAVAWTPILNASVVIRDALQAKVDVTRTAITAVSSLALSALAVIYVVSLFRREAILTRV